MMKINELLSYFRANGRYSFTIDEAEQQLDLSKIAALNAIHRIKQHGVIASPVNGFYLIVPPEYQAFGCLPADLFIDDLMKFLKLPYYVGYLSAAQLYGAAHQKPQRFQVVTTKSRQPIYCGRISIEFIQNKFAAQIPVRQIKTASGYINVVEPEALAMNLVSSPQHAAGISNVATVLMELAESFDINRFKKLATINTELFWIQRLGYLLEFLELSEIAAELFKLLENKKLHWIKLVSSSKYQALSRDSKWKIIINTEVEPDL
jgi:predicted transcriptional regulator of viral defense system